jgi:hypothetical protein
MADSFFVDTDCDQSIFPLHHEGKGPMLSVDKLLESGKKISHIRHYASQG